MTFEETSLKPCPFCGGDAEKDHNRPFRKMNDGSFGDECAIYCLSCSADMSICHDDHPGEDPEDLMHIIEAAWNERKAANQ